MWSLAFIMGPRITLVCKSLTLLALHVAALFKRPPSAATVIHCLVHVDNRSTSQQSIQFAENWLSPTSRTSCHYPHRTRYLHAFLSIAVLIYLITPVRTCTHTSPASPISPTAHNSSCFFSALLILGSLNIASSINKFYTTPWRPDTVTRRQKSADPVGGGKYAAGRVRQLFPGALGGTG